MYTPETSKHFTPYVNPDTGVTSYILSTPVATLQQSFYFTNPSMTDDGRYLWFYCAYPPSGNANYGRTLAVIDFETDEIYHYPDTMFLDASPAVDLKTGEIYFCNFEGIYSRRPEKDAPLRRIYLMPEKIRHRGVMDRMATHLTFSADHTKLGIDAEIGSWWLTGTVDIATGEFTRWYESDYCLGHLQMSPIDNHLVLMAEDFWTNKATGEDYPIRTNSQGIFQRLWTQVYGEEPRVWPVYHGAKATHEWWSRNGLYFYYVSYGDKTEDNGLVRVRYADGTQELAVPDHCWHGHSNADDTIFIYDVNEGFYRGCESAVRFYNSKTKKKLDVITLNPALFTREEPCVYHMDPHPQFTGNDRYVAFTTTVRGKIDFAICPVQQLIDKTLS